MVEHQMIYSPERKKKSHNKCQEPLLSDHSVTKGNNLLTLLAADPPSSRLDWVLHCLLSCFSYLCWVPTDFFHQSRVGQAPLPPFSCRPVPRSSGSRQLPVFLLGTPRISSVTLNITPPTHGRVGHLSQSNQTQYMVRQIQQSYTVGPLLVGGGVLLSD